MLFFSFYFTPKLHSHPATATATAAAAAAAATAVCVGVIALLLFAAISLFFSLLLPPHCCYLKKHNRLLFLYIHTSSLQTQTTTSIYIYIYIYIYIELVCCVQSICYLFLFILKMDTVIGLKGRDFVLLAADKYANSSIVRMKNDEDKLLQIDNNKILAIAGEAGDRTQFGEYIRKNVHLYRLRFVHAIYK